MLKHQRILSRIYNSPLLIDQFKLDVISSKVGVRLLMGENVDSVQIDSPRGNVEQPKKPKLGFIRVVDTLAAKNAVGNSGITTYEDIANQINYYIAAGIQKLLFYIDSHGGEGNGCFPLTDYINSLPSKYGIETLAYSDGYVTSGAYAIGRACQRLYVSNSSTVGSIAAVMDIIDLTEMDKEEGIKHTIIRSLPQKAIYSPHESMSKDVLDSLTLKLQQLSDLFIANINRYYPTLTISKIREFEGASFFGQQVLDLGLVDGIVTNLDELIQEETSTSKNKLTLTNSAGNINMSIEELTAQLNEEKVKNLTLQNQLNEAIKNATLVEQTRVLGIMQVAETFNMPNDVTIKQIEKGKTAEDVKDIFETAAQVAGQKAEIVVSSGTTRQPPNITESNPFSFLSQLDNVVGKDQIKRGI